LIKRHSGAHEVRTRNLADDIEIPGLRLRRIPE
jgi:hypothetical protein